MAFHRHSPKDPLVAGALALMPGVGHVYAGDWRRGVTYLAGTLAGLWLFVVPGLFLWAASVPDAMLCVRRRNLQAGPLWHPSALRVTDAPAPTLRQAEVMVPVELLRDPSSESLR